VSEQQPLGKRTNEREKEREREREREREKEREKGRESHATLARSLPPREAPRSKTRDTTTAARYISKVKDLLFSLLSLRRSTFAIIPLSIGRAFRAQRRATNNDRGEYFHTVREIAAIYEVIYQGQSPFLDLKSPGARLRSKLRKSDLRK